MELIGSFAGTAIMQWLFHRLSIALRGRRAARCERRPRERRPIVLAVLLASLIACLVGRAALAENLPRRPMLTQQQVLQQRFNDSTLMILGGYPGTTYFTMAHDIAAALNGADGLRLLAVDAAGGTESLRSFLFLRGIDLALVPANALVYADAAASFGPRLHERLAYITTLYSEEVHILVGAGISSLEGLRGKKIAVPPEDGNAEFTARDLLRRFRIEAEVVKVAAPDAIDDVRSGALAALVLMGGKPLRFVAGLPKDGSLHLLALPSTQGLGEGYSPAGLRAEDYPALIPDGQTIDTVSISAVVIANNAATSAETDRRVAKFVPALFRALSEIGGSQRHPKWSEVNLAATLAGWPRLAAAKEWLDKTSQEQTASVQKAFDEFLVANRAPGSPPLSPVMRRKLFEGYLKWTRNSIGAPDRGADP